MVARTAARRRRTRTAGPAACGGTGPRWAAVPSGSLAARGCLVPQVSLGTGRPTLLGEEQPTSDDDQQEHQLLHADPLHEDGRAEPAVRLPGTPGLQEVTRSRPAVAGRTGSPGGPKWT